MLNLITTLAEKLNMFFILDKNVKAKSLNILRKTKSERMVDIVKLFEVSTKTLISEQNN